MSSDASTIVNMKLSAGFLLAALSLAPVYAQESTTIKVDVDIVNVLCAVRNKSGGLVGNLEKPAFTLFEDGKQQELKYFAREVDLPLTIGLLIDVSRSQENLIDIERNAAIEFFSKVLRKKDEAFLISFGEEAELLQDYTNSSKLLRDGLSGLKVNAPVGGITPGPVPTIYKPRGTILFDAVVLASQEKLKTEVGRKALVLITDGGDQGSRYTVKQAIEAAQKADAIIYSIFYVDTRAYGGFGGGGEGYLRQMSEATGGRVLKVDRKHTLDQIFKEIEDEMRSQYSLGYVPSNPAKDNTFRKVEIKLEDKDMKAQARKGYYATKNEGAN